MIKKNYYLSLINCSKLTNQLILFVIHKSVDLNDIDMVLPILFTFYNISQTMSCLGTSTWLHNNITWKNIKNTRQIPQEGLGYSWRSRFHLWIFDQLDLSRKSPDISSCTSHHMPKGRLWLVYLEEFYDYNYQ